MADDPADLKRGSLTYADEVPLPTDSPAFDPHAEVAQALRAILDEVEARGPGGHWLSRDSHLVARARIALAAAGEVPPNRAMPREVAVSERPKKKPS